MVEAAFPVHLFLEEEAHHGLPLQLGEDRGTEPEEPRVDAIELQDHAHEALAGGGGEASGERAGEGEDVRR